MKCPSCALVLPNDWRLLHCPKCMYDFRPIYAQEEDDLPEVHDDPCYAVVLDFAGGPSYVAFEDQTGTELERLPLGLLFSQRRHVEKPRKVQAEPQSKPQVQQGSLFKK